jgi:hypothetical protein
MKIDLQIVADFFRTRRRDVRAVWVVHPAALDAPARVGVLSTVDPAPTHYQLYDDTPGDLRQAIGCDVEVVELGRVAPAMAAAIVREGQLAFERTPGDAASFAARLAGP